MQAGKLRHLVTIEERRDARDDEGAIVPRWGAVRDAYAQIEGLSGREYFQALSAQSSTSHRVRIRYADGVKPQQRLRLGGRVLNIDSVNDPDGRRKELLLLCTEVV